MHAGLLDMLHHSSDDHIPAVADTINIHLDGILQKPIDQHRLPLRDGKRLGHVTFKLRVVVTDFHGAATEHKAGANEGRITNPCHFPPRLLQRASDAASRLLEPEAVEQIAKFLSILRLLNGVDARANDRQPRSGQRPCKIEWRLPTELHNHAIWLNPFCNIEHVLTRERLKKKHVAGVVVSADRFWIGIDHHALDPHLAQSIAGVAAAVVKLDALTNAVGAAAQDHHPLDARLLGASLVLVLPG